jgi:hypothetical protein
MHRPFAVIALTLLFCLTPLVLSLPAQAAQPPGSEDVLPGTGPSLPLEEPRQQAIRDILVKWVKDNATDPRVPDGVAELIDKTLAQTNNFRFAIGAELNKTGKPWIIDCWDNRLFSFALTSEQAKAFNLGPRSVVQFGPTAKQQARRLATPLVKLEGLRFNAGGTIGNGAKINGEVTLKTNKAPADKYVLRLSFRLGNSMCQLFHYVDTMPQAGDRIFFSFDSVNRPEDTQRYTGPMPMYLDLCKIVQNSGGLETTIYSNTVAVLVDVVPGG